MQAAFGYVLVGVVVVSAIVAVVSLAGTSRLYEQIGRGGLSLHDEEPPRVGTAARVERDDEIRQLLMARNARRAARGEAERDVESELAALTRVVIDDGLRTEIRDLVVARNARRAARGREPLDVEAEIAREISKLSG